MAGIKSINIGNQELYSQNKNLSRAERNKKDVKAEKSGNGSLSISVSGLNFANDMRGQVAQKREFARKQAKKLIEDAWKRDTEAANQIDIMRKQKEEKTKELGEFVKERNDILDQKEKLRDEYGIDKDSQEQKDLELLEKYQDNKFGIAFDRFSEEEKERLKELSGKELTEYQKYSLELNARKNALDVQIQNTEFMLEATTAAITSANIEQLKSQDMLKAKDASELLIDSAEKEIMGMLIKEGMDNVEEDVEETVEEAKEKAEEKKEQDEKIQKTREERREQEELLEESLKADKLEENVSLEKTNTTYIKDAQDQINALLKENNLINDDIKGLEIDIVF